MNLLKLLEIQQNMNYKIIGFGGRLASGKTELAKICEEYGYEKLYFALPLKQLCADLLDISIDELNVLKRNNTPIDITVGKDWVDIIHEETQIPFDNINEIIGGITIHTVRDLLQIVGTDVIRKYNFNWHVERIKEMIEDGKKYVIDDVRFPNEKDMIERNGGVCWYVVRPTMSNVSNHVSETSLEWRHFDNVIVNNHSLNYLKYHWELFMIGGHDESLEKRRKIYLQILGNDKVVGNIGDLVVNMHNMDGETKSFTLKDALFIHEDEFTYTPKFINNTDIDKVTFDEEQKYAMVLYKDKTIEIVKNCFLIEDLKKYV